MGRRGGPIVDFCENGDGTSDFIKVGQLDKLSNYKIFKNCSVL
jgi:hypothetical protein